MKLKNISDYSRYLLKLGWLWGENLYYCFRQGRDPRTALLCDIRLKQIPYTTVFFHPVGIVISGRASVGSYCDIRQNVTIGYRSGRPGSTQDYPTIGDHVLIGAGAVIAGRVTVGDHAKIGANAVILADVPAGVTAVGVWKQ